MRYLYKIIETGEEIVVYQNIKEDPLTEYTLPETEKTVKVERLISGGGGFILKGNGWTRAMQNRGYGGKYTDKLRPAGTPVDAPNSKREADIMLQHQIDNGMLDGVSPSMSISEADISKTAVKPQTTEQQMDTTFNPYKND